MQSRYFVDFRHGISVSLRSKRFRLVSEQKKRPRNGIFGFDRARNETRDFPAVFDSCSSSFAPKPHRNACYAGYISVIANFSYGIAVLDSPQIIYVSPRKSLKVAAMCQAKKRKLRIKLFSILLKYVFAHDIRDLILLARVVQLEIDTNTYEVSSSKMLKINTPRTSTMDCSSTKEVSFELELHCRLNFIHRLKLG